MSIPISALVQVLPGTIVAAGNAVDINGLFITDSSKIPAGTVKSYSSITDIAKDFDSTEKEYKAADVYFKSYVNSTQKPARILFAFKSSATVSQGSSPQSPADFMNEVVKINRNWATFTTLYKSTTEDKLGYSTWTDSQNNRFAYVDRESPDASKDDWSDTWAAQVHKNKSSGSVFIYEEDSDAPLYSAFVMGCAASLDFNRLNGRTTFAYRTQNGLAPVDIDESFYNRLTDAGYNVYANFAATKEDFNFLQKGAVSGQFLWLDTFINQIWLNANLQLRSIYVLKDNPLLPYNRVGYSKFVVSWQTQAELAVNYGAIQTGVTLDPSQLQIVETAVGFDVSDTLASKGYYIDIKDAPASVRIERGSPPATLYYVDGGSIQSITLASIAIL